MAVIGGRVAEVQARAVEPRGLTILGSTGSVGCQTIDLVERNPDAYVVEALAARRNVDLLAEQARRLRPRFVALAEPEGYGRLKDALAGTGIEIAAGEDAVAAAADRPAEWVMAAIVGAVGLESTMTAVRRGAVVAFANKECLVCAGDLMMAEIARRGARLLPVDSEHNAIFQVFDFDRVETVERLILTASGGPFRAWDKAAMGQASPAQAVAHPNWEMGAKISVDSATMMNKGLELIEAHHLFQMPEDRIDILVHPQSVVHSMVAYVDGSVLAQMGTPDMRTPIAYTLAWPARMATPSQRLDLAGLSTLTFEPPDMDRFSALRLAREALRAGGTAPAVLNAANEVAVAEFLGGRIGFLDIAGIVESTLERLPTRPLRTLEEVYAIDSEARAVAGEVARERQ